jgi:hypothetical protein
MSPRCDIHKQAIAATKPPTAKFLFCFMLSKAARNRRRSCAGFLAVSLISIPRIPCFPKRLTVAL